MSEEKLPQAYAAVEAVCAERLASISPRRWQRLLWVRDSLRGKRNALLIGNGASVAAILLSREGVNATAFDPDLAEVKAVRAALAGDDSGVSDRVRLHPLEKGLPLSALSRETYDAVLITEGPAMGLSELLMAFSDMLEESVRVVVVVPIGDSSGNKQIKGFPSMVANSAPGFVVSNMSVVDGWIRASMSRRDGSHDDVEAWVDQNELLRMTEEGSAERVRILEERVKELQSKLERLSVEKRRLNAELWEIHGSTSFRFGLALATALRSPRALVGLPVTMFEILRRRKHRAIGMVAKQVGTTPAAKNIQAAGQAISEWQKEALRNRVRAVVDDGFVAIRGEVQAFLPDNNPSALATGYMVAAQVCAAEDRHDLEFALGSLAIETYRSAGILRGFLHVALRARKMQSASDTLRELHEMERKKNKAAIEFLQNFRRTSSYKIAALELIPPKPERWCVPEEDDRIAYVLHNSLPYSSGGYATRSQGVAKALVDVGFGVTCVTRPGFPLDLNPQLAAADLPGDEKIDGVQYARVLQPSRHGRAEYEYIRHASEAMTSELSRLKPTYVQAGSNYVTGLPALVAARRIGVPFFYEVRGLWEITRLSRDEDFGRSISFDVQRHIESTLAREADHVFTLTEPMREELIQRGVKPDRITLLPNSVDAGRFQAKARNQRLAAELGIPAHVPVIGYVGTFVVYEGLEDLVSACVRLSQEGRDFRLLLVGNENASGQERGVITEEIIRIAAEGGMSEKLIMPGRIAHDLVEDYYSLIDICPFPRKPWPVCEMVSPMKPLEALAMKKAVIVSSVRALTEMIVDGCTGSVYEKGSVQALAAALAALMDDADLRKRLGEAGREWVATQRSWHQVAERIASVISEFKTERAHQAESSISETAAG